MLDAKYRMEHNHATQYCYEDMPTKLLKNDNIQVCKLYFTFNSCLSHGILVICGCPRIICD